MAAPMSERAKTGLPAANRLLVRASMLIGRWTRGMTLGVRAVVIDPQERVFLVRHSYVPGWYLPGGGVEPGETLADALARELREEANIELGAPGDLHGLFLNAGLSRRDHVAVFRVRDFSQTAPKRPDLEIVEAGFFPIGDLPAGITRGSAERIAEIVSGRPPSPYW
jgi:8-oxo-dGTP pyrophosphatase MutT (NUDIX family)